MPRRDFLSLPPLERARAVRANLFRAVNGYLIFIVIVLLAYEFSDTYADKLPPLFGRVLSSSDAIGVIAIVGAIAVMLFARNQIDMGLAAMEQLDAQGVEGRELVTAIRELTRELRRRPNPGNITLSLFNSPTEKDG
jgi:hypothetical protein